MDAVLALGRAQRLGLVLPIAFAEIGDGLSQPSAMAAGAQHYPRIAGTASGLMGFLQMAMAAVGSFARRAAAA
jgi:DHA1 family bicyclomycin/chloramphenicol resistance-like MFS transporter